MRLACCLKKKGDFRADNETNLKDIEVCLVMDLLVKKCVIFEWKSNPLNSSPRKRDAIPSESDISYT